MNNLQPIRTPALQAGRLRHKIDIVQVASSQDTTGGLSELSNVVYANVWASVNALTGETTYAAGTFDSIVTHIVTIRYIGAAPSWKAGTTYAANAVIKDSNGNLQQAQNGGASGTSVPTWSATAGQTTTETTGLIWKNVGVAPVRSSVSAAMQVWFQGRQFQIKAVMNPDERTKQLTLLCTEINDSNQQPTTQPGGLT